MTDDNAKNKNGETPLMIAVRRLSSTPAELTEVTLLIEAGADVNAKNNDGYTTLKWAFDPEIKKLLKAAGAKK